MTAAPRPTQLLNNDRLRPKRRGANRAGPNLIETDTRNQTGVEQVQSAGSFGTVFGRRSRVHRMLAAMPVSRSPTARVLRPQNPLNLGRSDTPSQKFRSTDSPVARRYSRLGISPSFSTPKRRVALRSSALCVPNIGSPTAIATDNTLPMDTAGEPDSIEVTVCGETPTRSANSAIVQL